MTKTKSTKGEAKGPQGKGKTNGKATLPGSYARFTGNFEAGTPIRANAAKLKAFHTYGRLREHLAKAFNAGKTMTAVAEDLGVTAARVNELAVCLRLDRPGEEPEKPKSKAKAEKVAKPKGQPKAPKGTGEICVDSFEVHNGRLITMPPKEPKAVNSKVKKLPNGDILQAMNDYAARAMKA